MRRPLAVLLFALAIVAASPAAAFAADYYVATDGSDTLNTGLQGSPFATVQKALDAAAASGGGDVFVGPGIFRGSVTLREGVSLYGAGSDETTLTGSGRSVITVDDIGDGETVEGFTIMGGRAASGAGIFIRLSSPSIRDNTITSNDVSAYGWNQTGIGAGIYCIFGAPVIERNLITGNSMFAYHAKGVGIALVSSSAVVSDNTITSNSIYSSPGNEYGGGVYISGGAPVISGNTITSNQGPSTDGGGIYISDAAATVSVNSIEDNSGDLGGAIYVSFSSPTIEGNVISGNRSRGAGGGIYCITGDPLISNNEIRDNRASGSSGTMGGGIFLQGSSATVIGNAIEGNDVWAYGSQPAIGGGIYASGGSPSITGNVIKDSYVDGDIARGGGIGLLGANATVEGNVIDANTSRALFGTSAGGGIYCADAEATISDNVISGNRAEGLRSDRDGGGIYFTAGSALQSPLIENNTITGNTVSGYEGSSHGGGISCEGGAARISGNTVELNLAEGYNVRGGGIYLGAGSEPSLPVLVNNVVGDNRAEDRDGGIVGAGIYCQAASPRIENCTIVGNGSDMYWRPASGAVVQVLDPAFSTPASITNCIIWGNQGLQLSGCATTFSCVQGGTAVEGNIADDPLFADAPARDYRFGVGSPASDVASATVAPAIDIRGVSRPQGVGDDMGAHEYTPDAPPVLHAMGDAYTAQEDTQLVVRGMGVMGNDTASPDVRPLAVTAGTGPQHGALVLDPAGSFTYTPEADWSGTDSFTYTATDRLGHTRTAVAQITVQGVSDGPPVLTAIGNKTTDELAALRFTVTATDPDLPFETLAFSLGSGAPAGATINAATGAFSWTPAEEQGPGSYQVTVVVSDGELTDSETFAVTVAEVADPKSPVTAFTHSSASAPDEDPAASAALTAAGGPSSEATTPTVGEKVDSESGENPAADAPADEPSGEEPGFPWWVVVLVLGLGGLGLFGAIVRRRTRDAGVDTLEG